MKGPYDGIFNPFRQAMDGQSTSRESYEEGGRVEGRNERRM